MGVLGTVFSIFLLLFVGYAMKQFRILRGKDADLLNSIVLYLTLPAFIFAAIHSYRNPLPWSIVKVPVVGFAMIAVVLLIAYLLGRALRLDRPTLGALILAAGFGNTGFLGYPVSVAAFHNKGALVTAVLYDMFAMALPLYIVGSMIAAAFSGERVEARRILRMLLMPVLLTVPIALILRPVTVPAPIMSSITYLSNGTIPLVMISMGLSLSSRSLKGYVAPAAVACVLKLGMLPLISYFAYRSVGLTGVTYQSAVMESAMPTAVMAGVIAGKFGANSSFLAGVIFVSTLIGLATIPMTLVILGVR